MFCDDHVAEVLAASGGTSQRLEAGAAATNVLAERLEEAWGWGLLSAPLVQWFAEGADLDRPESSSSELSFLSGLGSHG